MTHPTTVSEEAEPVRRGRLLAAVESVRTERTHRTVFGQAKILHIMEGSVEIETLDGTHRLGPGMSFALGAGRWCRLQPLSRVRSWTVYADESFLRMQMAWFLPDKARVHVGLHPHEWDGGPMVLAPGLPALRQLEPLWRQMSVLEETKHSPETVAIRTVELFARWMSIIVPVFLSSELDSSLAGRFPTPVDGRLTDLGRIGHVGRATELLREQMDEPWTVGGLARAVAVSRTHLTRLFVTHTGVAPLRFLTQIRLTEFTRLIEETDFSVAHAAKTVGWEDPRVASTWFRRRYGITPSQYRLSPHPHRVDDETCDSCAELGWRGQAR